MSILRKPYLVIPKLIEQPTWGGRYILELKNWHDKPILNGKKIGQSYELFGGSKLAAHITDSRDFRFTPDMDSTRPEKDFIPLTSLIDQGITGPMPLLLKINQAYGNSFQLHIKPDQTSVRWKAKPESWYYFEDGLLTCGLKKGADLAEYKKTCEEIEGKMSQLSALVQSGGMKLEDAQKEAKEYIAHHNPWQYVNIHKANKYDLIDLSAGGIHHSWEEDRDQYPLGNVVYEVQLDVMDPECTIRSFDQGKIKDDGSIREIHIEDYFTYIDTEPEHNDIDNLRQKRQGNNLLTTPYYSLDIVEVASVVKGQTDDSFHHLYVRDGEVEVKSPGGMVHISRGHSCFVPQSIGEYQIIPKAPGSVVLKTYIPRL